MSESRIKQIRSDIEISKSDIRARVKRMPTVSPFESVQVSKEISELVERMSADYKEVTRLQEADPEE